MAATSQPLATQIALDILKAGGSAVDAAIAANAALGLMEPTGSGIGGDLFAIVWDAEHEELAGLNASGRSPKAMTLEYFRDKGIDKPIVASLVGDTEVEEACEYLYERGIVAYPYTTEVPVEVLGAKYRWARNAGLL